MSLSLSQIKQDIIYRYNYNIQQLLNEEFQLNHHALTLQMNFSLLLKSI